MRRSRRRTRWRRRAPSTGTPKRRSNSSAVSGGSGAVPDTTARRLARSSWRTSASSTIRIAEGTRALVVGRCRATRSTHPSTVNRSSNAIRRPANSVSSSRHSPLVCTIGPWRRLTDERSRGLGGPSDFPSSERAARRAFQIFSYPMSTRLGLPVVPLVSISMATPGRTAGRCFGAATETAAVV